MKIRQTTGMATLWLCLAIACTTLLSACDSTIYDYEEDCSVYYHVKFRYDYNLKYADAFASEVDTVTLYVLDENGQVVWQGAESGDTLKSADYAMTVEVPPGKYNLLAWCGSRGNNSFSVGQTRNRESLTCTMAREYDENGKAHVRKNLDRLFHGYLPNQTFTDVYGTHEYTVPLVKNTNSVRVVLQHLSGEPVDKDKFHFAIQDNNGMMDWDNSIMPDDSITYHAWYTASAVAGTQDPDAEDGGTHAFSAALAELTVARLMADHEPRLVITNTENNKTTITCPIVDYALMVKGANRQDMPDQEFLDRQDEYEFIFFIDKEHNWVKTQINILSWTLVLQNEEEL